MTQRRILVTGATGKVGRAAVERLLSHETTTDVIVRALCHRQSLDETARLEVVRGSIDQPEVVSEAMRDVTHVLHLATSKEDPRTIIDIAIKGLFWLLEACRESPTFQQFVLIGGDAVNGHYYYPQPIPLTETQAPTAYPGCYALSKVLEEAMLEQYFVQYDLNGCCLRAPWIMADDDLKRHLSFSEDSFGEPRWRDVVGAQRADEYIGQRGVPMPLDADGEPLRRNLVHVNDLVDAILLSLDNPKTRQQVINVAMDEPVDYGALCAHLGATRGYRAVDVPTDFHSSWLDNAKAKYLLDWRPSYDLTRLVDEGFGDS